MKNIILILTLLLCSFPQDKKEEHLDITIKNILGAYGGDEEKENAYFGIFENYFFYPDSNAESEFKLIKDTIILTHEENYIEKYLIIKVTKDSLILNNLTYEYILRLNRRGNKITTR